MRLLTKFSALWLSILLSLAAAQPAAAAIVQNNATANSRTEEVTAVIEAPSETPETAVPLPPVRNERSLGTFKTTGYSNPNGTRCADGSVPKAAHMVASDWGVLPRGSKIRFAGSDTIYTVEDNGVRGQIVDVYYATTAEAWAHGVQYREVYLILE